MAEPIIFTLLLGNSDQISEKISTREDLATPTIIKLQTNKELPIPDKERIFSEILEESYKQNKTPIFNIQLNDNNTKPIFKLKDITNLKNLDIKNIITFSSYNSLVRKPELATYWKEIFAEVDHVFFANKQDQAIAINENIISKDKTTVIQANDLDSVISVFNNLADDQKSNTLISTTIPNKKELDKIIRTTKNQNGRVIIKTWPLSLDEATNLITAKFGITSEDQIYGLKLEINEILKDQINGAKNLEKYVSQISQQFQKDLGKPEINPIDFNFDREQIMKKVYDNKSPDQANEQIKSPKPVRENQSEQPSFFRRVFNYFKDTIKAIFNKKEVTPVPQPQSTTKTESELKPTEPELLKEQTQQQNAPTLKAPPQQQATRANTANTSQEPLEQVKKVLPNNSPASTTKVNNYFNINDFKYEVSQEDINNVKKQNYWYTENEIIQLLTAELDGRKFSVQPAITFANTVISEETLKDYTVKGEEKKKALAEVQETIELAKAIPDETERNQILSEAKKREEILNLPDIEREKQKKVLLKEGEAKQKINEDILNRAVTDVKENGKEAAVIPIEMGYGHWTVLVAKYDSKDNQVILTFNDSLGNSINYDGQKLPKLIDKTFNNLPNKPITIDEQIKQQTNQSNCGVFTVDNGIKIAKGEAIFTTKEAKNKGQELRNQHAAILTKAMTKQQAQEIGQQAQNKQSNKYREAVTKLKTNDTSRSI